MVVNSAIFCVYSSPRRVPKPPRKQLPTFFESDLRRWKHLSQELYMFLPPLVTTRVTARTVIIRSGKEIAEA